MKLSSKSIERVASSFETLELGDPRRLGRFFGTLRKMARNPSVSFPDAMGSDADLQGGYRLVNNQRVAFGPLMAAHAHATGERARGFGRVICIHDTTTCESAHASPDEVGYLNTGKPGFLFHYALVVAPQQKEPLGVVHGEPLFRDKPPRKRKAGGRRKLPGHETAKKANRESLRWGRGIEAAQAMLNGAEVIHVADRESDSYELMALCAQRQDRFVFRTRVTARRASDTDGEIGSVLELASRAEGILTREVALSRRKGRPALRTAHAPRKARIAELEFAATRVSISRPRYCGNDLAETLEVNLVRVHEPKPPRGEEPVEWLLYTTEPIDSPEQVAEVVDAYRARWLIEECNKALKTGCLYEHREFESRATLLTILAMSLPIACEILWLRSCAREKPTRPAREILSDVQLTVLRTMGKRKLPREPTAHDALMAIADMGGHHRSNGDPGWLILQRGISKLDAYAAGWEAALAAGKM
jgi:hypothetical protein